MRKVLEKQKAARGALDKTPMNLTLSQTAIPKEHILLIQGRYDLLVEAEQSEELWQNGSSRKSGSFLMATLVGWVRQGLTGRVLHWLSPRLNAPAVQARPQKTLPDNAELQEEKRVIPSAFEGINP